MPGKTSANLDYSLTTSLGTDELIVVSFSVTETISEIPEISLMVASDNPAVAFDDLIGRVATLSIRVPGNELRYVSGYIKEFTQSSQSTDLSEYRMELAPWLWFLKKRVNSRIFQEMSVPAIVKEVFDDAGFSGKYEMKLKESYESRTYCTQYRESDYSFIVRLLREEGIFFYFVHELGEQRLILGDSASAYAALKPEGDLFYKRSEGEDARSWAGVERLTYGHSVRPTKVSLNRYDFTRPSTALSADAGTGGLEFYDNTNFYESAKGGERYARIRLEAHRADAVTLNGKATDRRLAAGHTCSLVEHPRDEFNTSYLLTSVGYGGAQVGETMTYHCTFDCIPADVPFRPQGDVQDKPTIAYCQTAVVVGPKGEEVWLDKYGRVRVRFHWDRTSKDREKTSCWIRVAQSFAGRNWGMAFHPRVGQEVVVQFIDGDPDQPLITGGVYNEEMMPPHELPANGTRSAIKSRSTPDGGADNYNEIMFEDKKGSEVLAVQAEKDHTVNVKNDQSQSIGNNRAARVGNDDSLEVKGNRVKTIEKSETVSITEDRTTTIEGTDTATVKGDQTLTVSDGGQTIEIGADRSLTVKGSQSISVDGDQSTKVGGALQADAGGEITIGSGANVTIEAGANLTIKAGGTLTIEATQIDISGAGSVVAQDAVGGKIELKAGMAIVNGMMVKI
ncbi:MAG: type VI secretion system tip protein VgrG, partial [Chitinivibrionales bacterium]|nr:type VI secretion system tip protein VgrG [Chitinivibrionales bacterium]